MSTQNEFFTTSTLLSVDYKNQHITSYETPDFYKRVKPQSDVPVYTVSLDDVLAEYMQKDGFKANFVNANKEIAKAFYKGEKSLRAMRLRQGLTQGQLAEAINTSQPQIAKLENGDTDFRSATVCKLAKFFGVKPGKMFEILIGEGNEA
ncbi:helix-turn-helix domain-containing protein [Rheinheimera fenheensis]|uniref:helix-turn-helix domain-containing protein n=1 Tax=Rheinheimera fenheensis TaxID=3152295 RepID=UPI00326147C9